MSNNNIDRMKKIIEAKKKTSSQQGSTDGTQNGKVGGYQKGFKNTKRGRAKNK